MLGTVETGRLLCTFS